MDLYIKDRTKLGTYMTEAMITEGEASYKEGERVMLRARITKFETLCVRAIVTSSHKKNRCQEYTSQFTTASRKDAAKEFCKPVWEQVDKVLRS